MTNTPDSTTRSSDCGYFARLGIHASTAHAYTVVSVMEELLRFPVLLLLQRRR